MANKTGPIRPAVLRPAPPPQSQRREAERQVREQDNPRFQNLGSSSPPRKR